MYVCICVIVYVLEPICFCVNVYESEFIHMPDGVGRLAEAMCVDTCNNGDGC